MKLPIVMYVLFVDAVDVSMLCDLSLACFSVALRSYGNFLFVGEMQEKLALDICSMVVCSSFSGFFCDYDVIQNVELACLFVKWCHIDSLDSVSIGQARRTNLRNCRRFIFSRRIRWTAGQQVL